MLAKQFFRKLQKLKSVPSDENNRKSLSAEKNSQVILLSRLLLRNSGKMSLLRFESTHPCFTASHTSTMLNGYTECGESSTGASH